MSNGEPQGWYDQFKHDLFPVLPIPMKSLPLHGKTVAITGTLSITRDQFAVLLEDAGAVVITCVSRITDILVVGADPGDGKLSRAREFNITIWDEVKARRVMDGESQGLHSLKVYGSSDDLIIYGDHELNVIDKPAYIRFTNGTYVKIVYGPEGIWRIDVLAAGRGKLRKQFGMPDDRDIEEDGPNPQAHGDKDAPVYSDVLLISSEEPIELESWGTAPLKEPSPSLTVAKEIFKTLEGFNGFESFTHELEQQRYNDALNAVAKVVDSTLAKTAMDKWMMP